MKNVDFFLVLSPGVESHIISAECTRTQPGIFRISEKRRLFLGPTKDRFSYIENRKKRLRRYACTSHANLFYSNGISKLNMWGENILYVSTKTYKWSLVWIFRSLQRPVVFFHRSLRV